MSVVLGGCKKEKKDNNDLVITPTPTAPIVTEAITPTPTPTISPTGEDESEKSYNVSNEDAIELILNAINDRGYFVQLSGNASINEKEYYVFQVMNADTPIEPDVIVDKETGEILCYYKDRTTAPFSEHPLVTTTSSTVDNDDKSEENKHEFTKEDALAMLSKVSHEVLELPVPLAEYTIVYDDWNSMINGKECYGINAFAKTEERMINMGVFFVAVDGSAMYKFDANADDFVELK